LAGRDRGTAQEALLEALADRDDGYSDLYKGFCIMSLGLVGDEKALPVLFEHLAPTHKASGKRKTVPETKSPLRGYAALALGLYARAADTPQGPADRPHYEKVCQALTDRMADTNETLEVRAGAAMGLGLTSRTENLRWLQKASQSVAAGDELLVGYTLLGRAMLGDRNVLGPAKRFLSAANDRDDSSGILARRAAVLGLGLVGTQEAVPILIDAWHLSYHVNREAALAMALAGVHNVSEPLVRLLETTANPLEGAFAARCLGELFTARRPPAVAGFLNGGNHTMKNLRMMPYQTLANEFLYTYLIPMFGDQWQ